MKVNIFSISSVLLLIAAGSSVAQASTQSLGQQVFEQRCSLCHGATGEGDGRLSKLIQTPAPANLTRSKLQPQKLREVIHNGAAAIGRSSKMPAWGSILMDKELEALLEYVLSLRSGGSVK